MSKYGKRAAGLLLTGVLCAGLLAGCGGAPEAAVTPTAPSESGSASGRRVETLRPHRCGRGHDHRPPGLRHGL